MSKPVFDIIAENPEIQHIACDMKKPAVHEHGSEYGKHRRYGLMGFEIHDVVRDGAVGIYQVPAAFLRHELEDKNECIQDDNGDRDEGERPRGVIVLIGNHRYLPFFCFCM
jgi:hypothetical protein